MGSTTAAHSGEMILPRGSTVAWRSDDLPLPHDGGGARLLLSFARGRRRRGRRLCARAWRRRGADDGEEGDGGVGAGVRRGGGDKKFRQDLPSARPSPFVWMEMGREGNRPSLLFEVAFSPGALLQPGQKDIFSTGLQYQPGLRSARADL